MAGKSSLFTANESVTSNLYEHYSTLCLYNMCCVLNHFSDRSLGPFAISQTRAMLATASIHNCGGMKKNKKRNKINKSTENNASEGETNSYLSPWTEAMSKHQFDSRRHVLIQNVRHMLKMLGTLTNSCAPRHVVEPLGTKVEPLGTEVQVSPPGQSELPCLCFPREWTRSWRRNLK